MNIRPTTMQLLQLGTACLCLVSANCSTSPGNDDGMASLQTRHPNLVLRPAKLSGKLLIADAELQGGTHEHGRWTFGRCMGMTAFTVATLPFAVLLGMGGVENLFLVDESKDYPFTAKCSLRPFQDTRASLWANEIHYQKDSGGQITLARAKGLAHLDVTDRLGSYRCTADEIHYRATTQEIILRGRVTVSAAYAPGISDFGLSRLDLGRGILEYSSGEKPYSLRSSSRTQ